MKGIQCQNNRNNEIESELSQALWPVKLNYNAVSIKLCMTQIWDGSKELHVESINVNVC